MSAIPTSNAAAGHLLERARWAARAYADYDQAAVSAIRHSPPMKTFYASLKARGKATKVAIVAVARKILVLANALIRDMTPYKPPANSVC